MGASSPIFYKKEFSVTSFVICYSFSLVEKYLLNSQLDREALMKISSNVTNLI